MIRAPVYTLAIFTMLATASVGPSHALPRNAIYECDMPLDADVPPFQSPGIYIDPSKCVQVGVCLPLKRGGGLICVPVVGRTRAEVVSALSKLNIRARIRTAVPKHNAQ